MATINFEVDWSQFGDITQGRVRETRLKARNAIGALARNIIMRRVTGGMSIYGELAPYSTKPFTFMPGHTDRLKPMVYPTGLKVGKKGGTFFKGGYAEYVQNIGQNPNLFNLTNTGDLWRDWRYFPTRHVNEPLELGFTDNANAIAANRNERRRPGMFDLSEQELDRLETELLNFLEETWSSARERARFKQR